MGKINLTARGMNFDEHCEYEDWRNSLLKDKKMTPEQYGREFVRWVFKNIYPDVNFKEVRAHEALAIAATTLELTETIREDEIKNLTSSLIGSASEQNTAKAAEK